MTGDGVLLQEVQGQVGTLIFNRPEKRNALSPEMLIALHMALKGWAESGDVRVVVITGSGDKSFSAGYDISAIPREMTPEMTEILRNHNPLTLAMESISAFPCPTIAMMNGYAFGAGLNLAVCCDFRIAAEGISVSMPPVKLGVVYDPDGVKRFVDVVGMSRTREIFLTGRKYTGEEALGMGLVNRIVRPGDLIREVYSFADEIASNAPLALKGMKRILGMLGAGRVLTEEERREIEALQHRAYASSDFAEAQAAFFEKRKPVFTGK